MKARYYLLAIVAVCPAAFGTTVVSQLFSAGSTGSLNELAAISWTQTGSYSNVDILANIGDSAGSGTATATAYLMTQIGAGTTAAEYTRGFWVLFFRSGLTMLLRVRIAIFFTLAATAVAQSYTVTPHRRFCQSCDDQ